MYYLIARFINALLSYDAMLRTFQMLLVQFIPHVTLNGALAIWQIVLQKEDT